MYKIYSRFIRFYQGCKDYQLIKKSTLFDPVWYLTKYPDVAATGLNPVWHYAHYGWYEHRDPCPGFSTQYYLNNNPDILKEGINPLLHYENYGKIEGQLPKPRRPGLRRENVTCVIKTPQSIGDLKRSENNQTLNSGFGSQKRTSFIREKIFDSITWQILLIFRAKVMGRMIFPFLSKMKIILSLTKDGVKILKNSGFRSFIYATIRHIKNRKQQVQNPFPIREKPSTEEFTIEPSNFLSITNSKIAIHVHVYYIDIFDEICEYLQNIPYKFTLLISITQNKHEPVIKGKLSAIPHLEHAIVRVVENRGRDLAPLLVEFGSFIRKFDYICHIHTKKSLYTGRERTDWRKYLFDRVIGSQKLVRAIFTAFLRDPLLGIVYPEIFPDLPYFACTWLSNKSMGSNLLNRLNIRFDPDMYFDYPTGSMFWMKKEALEPLLDLGLKITDFPEETGQADGTLQHCIERCLAFSAQSKGFHHLVVKDPEKFIFSSKSSKNLHQYLDTPFIEKFTHNLAFSRIVSFDLFDTLLIRPFATPHMVFSYLEEQISRAYGINNFKELRNTAERIARERKNYQEDVTISEIYSVFSDVAKIDSDTSSKLLNLEISTEIDILIPRKEVIDAAKLAKTQNKRLILISDTYLESTHIEKILKAKGIDFFDKMYISCETGKRKDRGDLWDYVIECEGLTPGNYLHVGDNEETDIQRIIDKGYRYSIHVMRPTALFQMSEFGSYLWSKMDVYTNWRENLLYGKYANIFCADPNEKHLFTSQTVFEDPIVFGYVIFGPIIFNFMNWLIKTTQKMNCDHLWFLAREGHVLQNAYNAMITHPKISGKFEKNPTSSYFLCSRRSVIFPLLKTKSDIHLLLDRQFKGTLRCFLTKKLNITSSSYVQENFDSYTLNQNISLPEDYTLLFNYLEKLLPDLRREAQIEREFIVKYCKEQGFNENSKIGVVDIGYSGTIQHALMELLEAELHGYYFITLKSSKRVDHETVFKACFQELEDPFDMRKIPLFKYSLLLEAVMTSPKGQLVRFSTDSSGNLIPIYKEGGISQKEFNQINLIHDGIIQFIEEMLDQFRDNALEIDIPNEIINLCYENVINRRFKTGSLKNILSVENDYEGMGEINVLDFYIAMQQNSK